MTNPYRTPTLDTLSQTSEPDYVRWTKLRLIASAAITAGLSALIVFAGQEVEDWAIDFVLHGRNSIKWNSIPVWLLIIHLGKFAVAAGIVTGLFGFFAKHADKIRTLAATVLTTGLGSLVLLAGQRIPAAWNMNWSGPSAMILAYLLGMISLAIIVCWLRSIPLRPSRILCMTMIGLAAFAAAILCLAGGTSPVSDDGFRRESATFIWSLITVVQITFVLRCPSSDTDEITSKAVQSASSAGPG